MRGLNSKGQNGTSVSRLYFSRYKNSSGERLRYVCVERLGDLSVEPFVKRLSRVYFNYRPLLSVKRLPAVSQRTLDHWGGHVS